MESSTNSIAARIAALKVSQEASQERPSSPASSSTGRKSSTSSISARIAAMQGVPVMGMPMSGCPNPNKRGRSASSCTQQSEANNSTGNVSRMMSLDMQNQLALQIGRGLPPSTRKSSSSEAGANEDALYPLLSRPIIKNLDRKTRVLPKLEDFVFSTEKQGF